MLGSARKSLGRKGPRAVVPNNNILGRIGVRSPRILPNNAAWYDIGDISSLRNNAGNIPSNGDGIKLIADKSGNSNTNCLCLNGAVGNYASAPDSAPLSITGDIDIRCNLAMDDWTPGAATYFVSKWVTTGNQRAYVFGITTAGNLEFSWSTLGSDTITKTSTSAVGFTDLASRWVRVTLDVNNGAAGNDVIFYTSTDGTAWTQLGTTVTTAGTTSIFDSTAVLNLGQLNSDTNRLSGRIYRAQIYNGIAGTLAFDANFALAAKLATSFTESSSNAATVTINTSGDLGARICGERDLYQGTAANQPILTIASTGNYLTFDGTNDYMKAAAFSLSQPETVYFVGSQVTWTANDTLYNGFNDIVSGLSAALVQNSLTPNFESYAGTALGGSTVATGTAFVHTAVFNSTASSVRVNRGTITTGNAGTNNPGGFTLGGRANGANCANITFSEAALYAAGHDTATQNRLALYAGRKWKIAV